MEIHETKSFIPRGFELGTTLGLELGLGLGLLLYIFKTNHSS